MSDVRTRTPERPAHWPTLGNGLTRWLGRTGLACLGWRVQGRLPDNDKLVIAVAPHTSNWDFFVGVFALLAIGARIQWLGKHSIFRWPVNGLLRSLGGIPVVRHAAKDVVAQAAEQFDVQPRLLLALSPEGTRRHLGRLKTGFLRIAKQAGVPVLPVGLDYPSRTIEIGEPWVPDGTLDEDERAFYHYFQAYRGRHPDQY
ncbi:1-acyl-sn-glycerol-3-phosphate acyltransferase [Saccharospirillum salsuginis]|uniref:Acyltransferase n=1 Tax=Saccharospirillum salsuginis TaxID=418750 RepID=A0A918JZT0_9GAMM|nr:1-acyl-sn-glycerol-3-phosphate acyltransferase [Saccharospirillum salsuginis]GGX40509.1 acyltransferase [Saccharospirillum salsuginis]